MEPITLSYIVTTRNKLSSLKEVLGKLIPHKQLGEEIIVADGASTDGTKEYLEKLLLDNSIDVLISESDKGEAHGYNKCLLRARGTLIKVITDDDDFDYPTIKKCALFMLNHPEIDLLATNGGKKDFSTTSPISKFSYEKDYIEWLKNNTPFSFCGLGLMIRKSSIPLVGLFSTNFIRVDAEFSLRTTASKAVIAWYTGSSFVHIANPRGNTITMHDRILKETTQLDYQYFNKKPSIFSHFKKAIFSTIRKVALPNTPPLIQQDPALLNELFLECDQWLEKTESDTPGKFLFKQ